MPFYKIRRYVSREGRQLGCDRDSPPREDEHLMIMFYDLLLLDDIICLHEPHSMRRRRLWGVVHRVLGRADIGTRVKVDLRRSGNYPACAAVSVESDRIPEYLDSQHLTRTMVVANPPMIVIWESFAVGSIRRCRYTVAAAIQPRASFTTLRRES